MMKKLILCFLFLIFLSDIFISCPAPNSMAHNSAKNDFLSGEKLDKTAWLAHGSEEEHILFVFYQDAYDPAGVEIVRYTGKTQEDVLHAYYFSLLMQQPTLNAIKTDQVQENKVYCHKDLYTFNNDKTGTWQTKDVNNKKIKRALTRISHSILQEQVPLTEQNLDKQIWLCHDAQGLFWCPILFLNTENGLCACFPSQTSNTSYTDVQEAIHALDNARNSDCIAKVTALHSQEHYIELILPKSYGYHEEKCEMHFMYDCACLYINDKARQVLMSPLAYTSRDLPCYSLCKKQK